MSTFTHRDGSHIEIDGAGIYCEQQGNPDGPPLLLLHGGLGDIETFNPIAPHLGATHRLIGIDSRGQGKSMLGSERLTYQRVQRDVEAVLRHLDVKRCSVLGHSDGGITALRLATVGTVEIDRLVTIGTHWTLREDDPTREIYATVTAAGWKEMFPHSYERYQALNPAPDFEKLVTHVVAMWLDSGKTGYPGEAIRDIASEVLVIRGDEDPLVSRAHAVEMADLMRSARLASIPFSGHSLHEEKSQWVLPMLDVFLHPDRP